MPTNVSFLRIAKKRPSHSFHGFFWHTLPSCTFSFTKAPRCPKLLIPASNAIGRWGITVELSPECPLNRNNWFVLHKLQHTKRLLLRSRHCSFVTSQTEREKRGVGLRMRTKLEHLLFRSMWETYFCVRFESRNGRLKLLQSFWHTLYIRFAKQVKWSNVLECILDYFSELFIYFCHLFTFNALLFINTLRTGSFKLFKRPFPWFLTILTL